MMSSCNSLSLCSFVFTSFFSTPSGMSSFCSAVEHLDYKQKYLQHASTIVDFVNERIVHLQLVHLKEYRRGRGEGKMCDPFAPSLLSDEGCLQPVVRSCRAGWMPGIWLCPGIYRESSGPILKEMFRLFTVMV